MLTAGTETGSLMNHLLSRGNVAPQVGMGVTLLFWTDREAGTIIKVNPKTFTVQMDHAKRTDNNGMSESQEYEYTPNPNGRIYVFRLTKKGWRSKGTGCLIGQRRQYHDYSF